jgi:hypothetical protein
MSLWYLVLVIIECSRAQDLFNTVGDGAILGGGFLVDPFLELTAGVTTLPSRKANKFDTPCLSNGSLAMAIICTLILSAFIAFLTWLVYLRQKLHGELIRSMPPTIDRRLSFT